MNKKILSVVCILLTLSMLLTANVFATSATRSTSAPGGTLTSNFWIQALADWTGTGEWQVSAVYNGTASLRSPNWIKTAWDFYAIGVSAGVSSNGISGSVSGSGSSSSSAGYWVNSNGATTAWYRGTVRGTGLAIYVGGNNTASLFALGVPASVTTGV